MAGDIGSISRVETTDLGTRLDFGMRKREKSNMTERFLDQVCAGETVTTKMTK